MNRLEFRNSAEDILVPLLISYVRREFWRESFYFQRRITTPQNRESTLVCFRIRAEQEYTLPTFGSMIGQIVNEVRAGLFPQAPTRIQQRAHLVNYTTIDRVHRVLQNCPKSGILMCIGEDFGVHGNNVLELIIVGGQEVVCWHRL